MTAKETVALQRALNDFTAKHLKGVTPLIPDGDFGAATKHRVRQVKHWLGWPVPTNSTVGRKFASRMLRPRDKALFPKGYVELGRKRRRAQRRHWRRQQLYALIAPGVTRFDGVPVAVWLVPYLEYARKNGWQGKLVSGWRSPAYSESLCLNMCGQPSCPGRCAGKTSNHSGSVKPKGAVDVSDYARFGQLMARCPRSPRIFNALGAQDPVHFSSTGR